MRSAFGVHRASFLADLASPSSILVGLSVGTTRTFFQIARERPSVPFELSPSRLPTRDT